MDKVLQQALKEWFKTELNMDDVSIELVESLKLKLLRNGYIVTKYSTIKKLSDIAIKSINICGYDQNWAEEKDFVKNIMESKKAAKNGN